MDTNNDGTTNNDMPTTSTPEVVSTSNTNESTTPDTTPVVAEEVVVPMPAPATINDTTSLPAVDQSVPTAVTPVAPAVPVSPWSSTLMQYGIAGVIILIMGVGLWYMLEEQGRVNTGVFEAIKTTVVPEPAAAIVNGERISVEQVERNKEQLRMAAVNQGLDPADPSVAAEIDTQAVDLLINTEILRQAAADAGITLDADAVAVRYQEIATQLGGEEALAARMAELGLTAESLQSDIEGELIIQQYLDQAVDVSSITISEEEIASFYEQVGGGNTDFPPLADIRDQIEAELRNQQQQQLISAHIDELKQAAVIEITETTT